MKIDKLLVGIKACKILQNNNKSITKITFYSKKASKNSIFFCISGTKVNGEQYVFEAIQNGAVAVVLQKEQYEKINNFVKKDFFKFFKTTTFVLVDDVRKAMAKISANFYNNPQKKIKMVGITGTNGKTSTSYIIAQMLRRFGKKVGIIGTSGIFVGNKKYSASLTTPDSPDLFKILAKMVKHKVEYCVMEVSAHAIFLNKTYGINWSAKVLTNVKSDHLDFFKTKQNYESVKESFFTSGKNFVTNGDDKIGKKIAQSYPNKTTTFGFLSNNNIKILRPKLSLNGSQFDLKINQNVYHFDTNLIGKFNLYNFASSVAVLKKLGFSTQKMQKNSQKYDISGRFSVFEYKNNCKVVIDYAHTTDSLKNFLQTVKSVSDNKNIIVFGCPGERESQKRFDMGLVAGKYCQTVIVTTDNPASENPRRIAFEILCGAKKTNAKLLFVEDRAKAIKKAFSLAKKNANILIVGKGSETCQIVGDKNVPYSDFEEAKKNLA